MARKYVDQVSDPSGSSVPSLRSLALEETRKKWDATRAAGMKRLFKLIAEDAAVKYELLVKGSHRARARFGILPDEDLAYEAYVMHEMRLKSESGETPVNSPTRVPLRAPSKG